MHITIKRNTSSWTSESLHEALRIGLLAPNNPYAERVKRVSVVFVKAKSTHVRLMELGRTGAPLNWAAKISLPVGICSRDELARTLRWLAQLMGNVAQERLDKPWDSSKPAPDWAGMIDMKPIGEPDHELMKSKQRAERIAACRTKVKHWEKQEATAKRWRLKWEKMLKTQERGAERADAAFLKSGKLGLTRGDLDGADLSFDDALTELAGRS